MASQFDLKTRVRQADRELLNDDIGRPKCSKTVMLTESVQGNKLKPSPHPMTYGPLFWPRASAVPTIFNPTHLFSIGKVDNITITL
jgi:hypothetical protein